MEIQQRHHVTSEHFRARARARIYTHARRGDVVTLVTLLIRKAFFNAAVVTFGDVT